MESGEVYCDYCGDPLGNYLTGDFYRLIRQKYCKTCRKEIRRDQVNAAQRAKRHRTKLLQKKKDTAITEMEQMIMSLREYNKLLLDKTEELRRERER